MTDKAADNIEAKHEQILLMQTSPWISSMYRRFAVLLKRTFEVPQLSFRRESF